MEGENISMIIALDNKNTCYYNDIYNIMAPINDILITGVFSGLCAVLKLLEVQYTDILILDNALPTVERQKAEQFARSKNISTYFLEITDNNQNGFNAYLYQVSKSYILNTIVALNPRELLLLKDLGISKKEIVENTTLPMGKEKESEVNEPIRLDDLKRIQEGITYLFNYIEIPKHLKGYSYLTAAVEMLYVNPHRYNELKQTMYRNLSAKFNTTQIRVSKGMRLAVIQALQKGNPEALQQLGFRKYAISEIGNDDHKNNLPSTFCFIDALVSELYRILLDL